MKTTSTCGSCGGRSVLYDSVTRYEDDSHARGYNVYCCTVCGRMYFEDWEVACETDQEEVEF